MSEGGITPPDREDDGKPVALPEGAKISEQVTGKADPQGPDGILTADDIDRAAGSQNRVVGGPDGASAAGQAPGGGMRGRLTGSDASAVGALNSGGDSLGGDSDLPGLTGDAAEGP